MEKEESILAAMNEEDDEYLDLVGHIRDLDMIDSEYTTTGVEGGVSFSPPQLSEPKTAGDRNGDRDGAESNALRMDSGEGESMRKGNKRDKNQKKKKRKRNKKKRNGSDDLDVTNINRFVLSASYHLKERKPYLIWNAVGCLGVSAVKNLINEVDAIQACGGQQTSDCKRLRFGGGILWNILKTREPKAYKHIMGKGKEFERQFRNDKSRKPRMWSEKTVSPKDVPINGGSEDKSEAVALPKLSNENHRVSALDRIRVPVAYNDLFEEGEIV